MNGSFEYLKSQRRIYINSSLSPEQAAELLEYKLRFSEFRFISKRDDLNYRLEYECAGTIGSLVPVVRVKIGAAEWGSKIDIVIDLPLSTKVFVAVWEMPFLMITFFYAVYSLIVRTTPIPIISMAFAAAGYAFVVIPFNISAITAGESLTEIFLNEQ